MLVEVNNKLCHETLLLVTGINRLDPEIHNKIIERYILECPYDYLVTDCHKEEYEKFIKHVGWVQPFKLWDIVQTVPNKYKYIINVRNDTFLHWNYNPKHTIGSKLINTMKKEDVNIFTGTASPEKLVETLKTKNHTHRWVPDLIKTFHRDSFLNPWTQSIDYTDYSVHYVWCKLFSKQIVGIQAAMEIVRKGQDLNYIVKNAGLPDVAA